MTTNIDALLAEEPIKWVQELPEYQREAIEKLLSDDASFLDKVFQAWLNASAENTYRFAASTPVGDKGTFLENLKREVRAFLCGDKKYRTRRAVWRQGACTDLRCERDGGCNCSPLECRLGCHFPANRPCAS